jgi:hypothetical protein
MRQIGWRVIRIFSVLCLVALCGAGVTKADSVIYTLTGSSNPAFGPPSHTESFQFTASSFITSYIGLSASELDSCVACIQSGTAVEFYPSGTQPLIIAADLIRFTDANDIVYGFFFDPGAFSAPGTYTTFEDEPYITSNVGTLTVQLVPALTPEPSSLLLVASGLLGLLGTAPIRKLRLL